MSTIIDIHVQSYPSLSHMEGTTAILLTVLVQRVEGTRKAYAAVVPDDSRNNPEYHAVKEWVAHHGNPLRFDEAKLIWPMPREVYAA